MWTIHLGIRIQLTVLICLVVVFSLTILAIVTGVNTTNYNNSLTEESLAVVAVLKASQISQAFLSLYYQIYWISTRDQIQLALSKYRAGNTTESNWNDVFLFFNSSLGTSSELTAVGIYDVSYQLLFNTTNTTAIPAYDSINDDLLPLGPSKVPPASLSEQGGAISGPFPDEGQYLMSITLPIYGNSTVLVDKPNLTGYITIVSNTKAFQKVIADPTGLTSNGRMVLAAAVDGGINGTNVTLGSFFRYLLPPDGSSLVSASFSSFPALLLALTTNTSGALIDSRTPDSSDIAIGYAAAGVIFEQWAVGVEEPHTNVYAKTRQSRNIVIGTACGTAGFIVLLTILVAHFAVQPIYRLRTATEKTTLQFMDDRPSPQPTLPPTGKISPADESSDLSRSTSPLGTSGADEAQMAKHGRFRVPMKVPETGLFFRDELTDLTRTYNRMVDELVKQYFHLEDRVRERTRESEAAKIQAENANEAKSLFIANITHELRTPLNGILGITAVSLSETDPSKMRKSLKLISKSGELLLELLTDLLTFSKNQIGHITLDEKDFRVSDITKQLSETFETEAEEKNIKLTMELSPQAESTVVYGDSGRILQILVNLVSNGLKFNISGGRVVVRARLVNGGQSAERTQVREILEDEGSSGARKITSPLDEKGKLFTKVQRSRHIPPDGIRTPADDGNVATSSDAVEIRRMSGESVKAVSLHSAPRGPFRPANRTMWLVLEVEDTGPGIPESLQKLVFEPFTQGDQALSRKFGGTGLGLSICRQLADVLGGRITLKSKLQVGTTFTVRIPVLPPYGTSELQETPSISTTTSLTSQVIQRSESNGNNSSSLTRITSFPRKPSLSKRVNVGDSYFSLPRRSMTIHTPVKTDTRTAAELRILIAEDNVINQEIVQRMLKLEGIRNIEWSLDGEQVIGKVEDAIKNGVHYDVVFMDVEMPKMNGIEATKVIRGTLGYPYTIIALTGHADSETNQMCLNAGMNGLLTKPIVRLELHKLLVKFCPGFSLHEPSIARTLDSPDTSNPGSPAG